MFRTREKDNSAKTKSGAQLVFLIIFLIIFINLLANNVRKENKIAVATAIIYKRQVILNFYFIMRSHSGIM